MSPCSRATWNELATLPDEQDCRYDIGSDMRQARHLGFHESLDTAEMFLRMFQEIRDKQVIP